MHRLPRYPGKSLISFHTKFGSYLEDYTPLIPRVCKYYTNHGRCKFEEFCTYLHKINEQGREQEKDIEKLKKEVEELKNIVKELKKALNHISNLPNQTSIENSCSKSKVVANATFTSNCSSITRVQTSHSSNSQVTPSQVIPQLDGILNPIPAATNTTHEEQSAPKQPPDVPLKCETCHETFENEDQFNEHDSAQFCCDECCICFRTK